MPNNMKDILNDFLNRVQDLLGNRLKKIILYGSYARGDYTDNSDVDIMILTDFNDDDIIEYRGKIREIACDIEEFYNYDINISPILRNIDKYNERINIIPFYINVEKEGVVLREQKTYRDVLLGTCLKSQ